MARSRWTLGRIAAYSTLIAIVVTTLVLGGREYAKLFRFVGGPTEEREHDGPPPKHVVVDPVEVSRIRAIVDTEKRSWRVGGIARRGQSGNVSYEATVVNDSGREVGDDETA